MEGTPAPECSAQLLVPDGQVPEPAQLRRADAVSVVDTTELRWFVPGPLPPDVRGWFTGSTGVPEERWDTYLLDGRVDIGVKRRFRETLELKVRQSLDGRVELGDGLGGLLEVWRKWSPAEGLVEDDADGWCGSTFTSRWLNDGSVWTVPRSLSRRTRTRPVRAATSRSLGSRLVPSRRGPLRSRRSARPRPDGTLCSRHGRRWWPATRARSRSGNAPVERWATRNGSRSRSRRILQEVSAAAIKHHDVADAPEPAKA